MVARLKARDEQAFAALYTSYSNALLSIIGRITGNDVDLARDIFQEAMVKIWNHMDQYDPGKGTLFTWMMNICRNTAIDKTRSRGFRNQAKTRSLDVLPGSAPQPSVTPNPEVIGVKNMLEKLDTQFREVVDVVYMKGYSHGEAAELLNIPLGTVKSRLRSALLELRKQYRIA